VIESYLAIPVIAGTKSESEKFAGAVYTTSLEAMMPDGKALQMGTSHYLGQNFGKVFDVKYVGEDKLDHYVWQTSWGMSTRTIGALVMVHGDDKGLVMPPKVAPVQVVIVPIPYKGAEPAAIAAKAKEIEDALKIEGLSVVLDDREEYTPGWKFNQWELKGVPVRVEIGPRDLKQGQAVLVRRDSGVKTVVKEQDIATAVARLLVDIQDSLFAKAKSLMMERTASVQSYEEFKKVLCEKGGFIKAGWCGDADCEAKIKEETGATIRVLPFDKEKSTAGCIYCGKPAKEIVYFARSY